MSYMELWDARAVLKLALFDGDVAVCHRYRPMADENSFSDSRASRLR